MWSMAISYQWIIQGYETCRSWYFGGGVISTSNPKRRMYPKGEMYAQKPYLVEVRDRWETVVVLNFLKLYISVTCNIVYRRTYTVWKSIVLLYYS